MNIPGNMSITNLFPTSICHLELTFMAAAPMAKNLGSDPPERPMTKAASRSALKNKQLVKKSKNKQIIIKPVGEEALHGVAEVLRHLRGVLADQDLGRVGHGGVLSTK